MAVAASSFFGFLEEAVQVLDLLPGELLGAVSIPHGHLDVGVTQDLLECRQAPPYR